jgi:hypothetical protein
MDYYDPHVDIPVFTLDTGEAILKIMADSLLLHTEKLSLHKGLSYYPYHLTLDEHAVDGLVNYIKTKDSKAEPVVKKRDNEQYYLPAGKYKLVISKDGKETESILEIK